MPDHSTPQHSASTATWSRSPGTHASARPLLQHSPPQDARFAPPQGSSPGSNISGGRDARIASTSMGSVIVFPVPSFPFMAAAFRFLHYPSPTQRGDDAARTFRVRVLFVTVMTWTTTHAHVRLHAHSVRPTCVTVSPRTFTAIPHQGHGDKYVVGTFIRPGTAVRLPRPRLCDVLSAASLPHHWSTAGFPRCGRGYLRSAWL